MSFRGHGNFNKPQRGGQQNQDSKIPSLFENTFQQQPKPNQPAKGFDKSRLSNRREQHDKEPANDENPAKKMKSEKIGDKADNRAKPTNINGNVSIEQADMNQNKNGPSERFNARRSQNFQGNFKNQNKFQNNRSNFHQQRMDMKMNDRFPGMGRDRIQDKAKALGQLFELEPIDMAEKKFNAFSKLFVTNLPRDITQEELKAEFEKFGEISQIYIHKDTFAFVTFDFKETAQKARKEMNGKLIKGRNIQVRVASVNEGITVKNLSHTVSNEMLEKGFSIFGPVESCRVNTDERGRSTGEGVVVFRDKRSALTTVAKCQDECYILTGTSRPVIVSPLEVSEVNEGGLGEENLMKDDSYNRDRSVAPHFAAETSFEYELSMEWKKIFQQYEDLKKQMQIDFDREVKRMEQKLVLARVEYEKDQLRKELAAREAESDLLRRRFDVDMPSATQGYPGGDDRRFDPYMNRPPTDGYDRKVYESDFPEQYDPIRPQEYSTNFSREYERGPFNYEGAFDMQPPQETAGGQDRPFAETEQEFDGADTQSNDEGGFQQFKRLPPPPDFGPFKRARF